MTQRPVITFYQRNPKTPGRFSIEFLFASLRSQLETRFEFRIIISPFIKTNILNIVLTMLDALIRGRGLFHQPGDIHFANLLIPKRRSILTIHDTIFMHQRKGLRGQIIKMLWLTLPIRRAARVVTISDFSKSEIVRFAKIDPDRIKVIHSWISKDFKYSAKDFEFPPSILHVGTTPNKNLSRVIASLCDIECTLTVVGRMNQSDIAKAKSLGVVLTQRSDLSLGELVKLYQSCDIVSFPSLYEGFGMPILGAQASGRPVVTSNRCSMPEIAGVGACFVDPESVESIRMGFLKIIKDREYREDLVRKGLENVGRFSAEIAAERYANIYDDMFLTK